MAHNPVHYFLGIPPRLSGEKTSLYLGTRYIGELHPAGAATFETLYAAHAHGRSNAGLALIGAVPAPDSLRATIAQKLHIRPSDVARVTNRKEG